MLRKKLRKFKTKLSNQKELNDELKCEIKKCKFGKLKKFQDGPQAIKHVHVHKEITAPHQQQQQQMQ
jgi:hypothetical protein